MPFRDILLFMASYPRRTPAWAIEASSRLAEQHGARLSAALCQTHLPQVGNWLADKLVHANELIAVENNKSKEAATALLAEFTSKVGDDIRGDQILIDCVSLITPGELARRARAHDLTIVPIEADLEYQVATEGLIFESGRPVLLLPRTGGAGHRIESVVVGWDGSRSAARALAGAMPFCKSAKSVRLVLVTGDKEIDADHSLGDIQRHLALHDVVVSVDEIASEGRDAGTALMNHCIETVADLLVMGAFGHSRARELVLGGATRSVLDHPLLPILVAH